MENRTVIDDERIQMLEEQLKQAKYIAEERELMYEEVCSPACVCCDVSVFVLQQIQESPREQNVPR